MKSLIGQLLNGRYLINRQLDQKSFYSTYLAEIQPDEDRTECLVKQYVFPLKPGVNTIGNKTKNLILKEVGRTSLFNFHPQVPVILDYFFLGQEFYLVRKFVRGEAFQSDLEHRQLEETEIKHILKEILDILGKIHQEKFLHLNLKPSNIIFGADNQEIFLTDLGNLNYIFTSQIYVSKISRTAITDSNYLAAEQKQGKSAISSDFYALGAIAIKALTGKYLREVRLENLDNYARASFIDKETAESFNVSVQFAKVLLNLVRNNPEDRYQSTQEVLEALDQQENVFVLPSLDTMTSSYDNVSLHESDHSEPAISAQKSSTKRGQKAKGKGNKNILVALFLLTIIGSATFALLKLFPEILKFELFHKNKLVNPKIELEQQYLNENHNVKLDYPAGWKIKELEDPITGEVMVLTAPLEGEQDTFQEQIYLSIIPIPGTPENYEESLIDKLIDVPNITNIYYKQESGILANQKSHSVSYERSNGLLNLQQKEIFTIDQQTAYLITFISEKDQHETYLPIVNSILKSFAIAANPNKNPDRDLDAELDAILKDANRKKEQLDSE